MGMMFFIVAAALLSNLWTYSRLTHEVEVATISFQRLAPMQYQATFAEPDKQPRQFVLHGDEWQLDTRIVKWKGWVNLLGRHTLFELDRLSGRYRDPKLARQSPVSIADLRGEHWLDIWQWARDYPDYVILIDAQYGSSVFLPMRDQASYRITMGPSGVLARPVQVRQQI